MKVLILYAYCENPSGKTRNIQSKDNLLYFLKYGLVDNNNYQFIINCSGSYTINFLEYTQKYKNLKIINQTGKNAYHSWFNILKSTSNNFDYYIFMKDKIRGPYFNFENWIYWMIQQSPDSCIISGFGTSPHGRLSRFPYISDKFFILPQNIYQILKNNKFLENNFYETEKNEMIENHTHDTLVEIKLSKLLLDHNINYVSLDTQGVLNLDILKYYREKNWEKLFEITQKLHQVNDTTIQKRLFWTGTTMKKIFEDKNKKFIRKLQIPRDISQLEKW